MIRIIMSFFVILILQACDGNSFFGTDKHSDSTTTSGADPAANLASLAVTPSIAILTLQATQQFKPDT